MYQIPRLHSLPARNVKNKEYHIILLTIMMITSDTTFFSDQVQQFGVRAMKTFCLHHQGMTRMREDFIKTLCMFYTLHKNIYWQHDNAILCWEEFLSAAIF
jgi:hypothetical protein